MTGLRRRKANSKKTGESDGALAQAKALRGSELKIAFVKYDFFEACTSGYGFLNPLNLVATVSSGQAWQVQRQSVLDGLGLIG